MDGRNMLVNIVSMYSSLVKKQRNCRISIWSAWSVENVLLLIPC